VNAPTFRTHTFKWKEKTFFSGFFFSLKKKKKIGLGFFLKLRAFTLTLKTSKRSQFIVLKPIFHFALTSPACPLVAA
jgi:hypothetical protein